MSEDVLQIIYASAAHPVMSEEEITELVQDSRPRNESRDVTGLLLHSHGNFLQLLEGLHEQVNRTFGSICNDSRHGGIRILHREMADDRICENWSMGYGRPPKNSAEEDLMFRIISESPYNRLADNGSQLAKTLMRSFLKFI